MIRPLRRAHFVIWAVIALILAFGFTLGLTARQKPPVMEIPQALK